MAKSKQGLLDSSVVMALFNLEDSQHWRAIDLFKKLDKEEWELVMSGVAVVEMVSLIKYRRLENWKKHAERLVSGKLFKIDNPYEFDPDGLAWELVIKEKNIGMVDAIEIEHCLKNNEELLTFDKKQEEVWRKFTRGLKVKRG